MFSHLSHDPTTIARCPPLDIMSRIEFIIITWLNSFSAFLIADNLHPKTVKCVICTKRPNPARIRFRAKGNAWDSRLAWVGVAGCLLLCVLSVYLSLRWQATVHSRALLGSVEWSGGSASGWTERGSLADLCRWLVRPLRSQSLVCPSSLVRRASIELDEESTAAALGCTSSRCCCRASLGQNRLDHQQARTRTRLDLGSRLPHHAARPGR